MLKEIVTDYGTSREVSNEDLRLIQRNFEHLGHIDSVEDDPRLPELRNLAIVPGRDSRLHPPNRVVIESHKHLLDQFDPDTIAVVNDESMNESGSRMTRAQSVCVSSVKLSSVASRRRRIERRFKIEVAY